MPPRPGTAAVFMEEIDLTACWGPAWGSSDCDSGITTKPCGLRYNRAATRFGRSM
jgi:hypothetical protein